MPSIEIRRNRQQRKKLELSRKKRFDKIAKSWHRFENVSRKAIALATQAVEDQQNKIQVTRRKLRKLCRTQKLLMSILLGAGATNSSTKFYFYDYTNLVVNFRVRLYEFEQCSEKQKIPEVKMRNLDSFYIDLGQYKLTRAIILQSTSENFEEVKSRETMISNVPYYLFSDDKGIFFGPESGVRDAVLSNINSLEWSTEFESNLLKYFFCGHTDLSSTEKALPQNWSIVSGLTDSLFNCLFDMPLSDLTPLHRQCLRDMCKSQEGVPVEKLKALEVHSGIKSSISPGKALAKMVDEMYHDKFVIVPALDDLFVDSQISSVVSVIASYVSL